MSTIGKLGKDLKQFKVNNEETRMTGIFIVNFEYMSGLFLAFLLLTLNK